MPKTVLDCCWQQEIPKEYLNVKNHATPTSLERNTSRDLVDVYLQTCTPFERALFGQDKPLKGPGSELWINPSDRTKGLLKITPSKAEKIQALTHRGILEIGKQIEVKMSEENRKNQEKVIQEVLELAKFEADQRIKFHVENETKKLNEEWEDKTNRLQRQQEKEINVLKERHENEVRTIILENENLFKTVQEENILRENLGPKEDEVRMTNSSLNRKTFEEENLDRELTQQSAKFQEQLENTLKNLEINDRDRMEEMRNQCLKAMDIQNHLTACKHMTDMMQLLATQRKQNKHRNMKMRNEQESIIGVASGEHARLNQSKSIKYLWRKLLGTVDDVHNAQLDSDEKEIVDKIQQIRGDLNVGKVDEIFVISEHETNHGRLDHTANDVDACKISQRPIVEWEKSNEDEIPDGNSFTSLLFKQPQERRTSQIPKVTSSIMKMARGEMKLSDDDQDTLMKKLLVDLTAPDVDVLLLPKTNATHIKDSIDGMERRVSIHAKPHRCSHLLAAVDSIELLTRRDELSILTPNNSMRSNISHVLDGAAIIPAETNDLTTIPTYLKPPAEQRPRLYARMTKSEWEALRNFEQPSTSTEQKCSRRSTVSFDGSPVVTSSRKSSILKNPLASEKKEIDQENDALHPIRMKCREVIGKMKVEEVLKMLCDDDDE